MEREDSEEVKNLMEENEHWKAQVGDLSLEISAFKAKT
jgi:hypothetical protein